MTAACVTLKCPDPVGSACHCGGCHQTFGSLMLFDAHQDVDHSRPQGQAVRCRPADALRVTPAGNPVADIAAGAPLVQDSRGTWQTPAGLARREQATARLARHREANR